MSYSFTLEQQRRAVFPSLQRTNENLYLEIKLQNVSFQERYLLTERAAFCFVTYRILVLFKFNMFLSNLKCISQIFGIYFVIIQ